MTVVANKELFGADDAASRGFRPTRIYRNKIGNRLPSHWGRKGHAWSDPAPDRVRLADASA